MFYSKSSSPQLWISNFITYSPVSNSFCFLSLLFVVAVLSGGGRETILGMLPFRYPKIVITELCFSFTEHLLTFIYLGLDMRLDHRVISAKLVESVIQGLGSSIPVVGSSDATISGDRVEFDWIYVFAESHDRFVCCKVIIQFLVVRRYFVNRKSACIPCSNSLIDRFGYN